MPSDLAIARAETAWHRDTTRALAVDQQLRDAFAEILDTEAQLALDAVHQDFHRTIHEAIVTRITDALRDALSPTGQELLTDKARILIANQAACKIMAEVVLITKKDP